MKQGKQISAEDIKGLSSGQRAAEPAYLTDEFTNRDIFGTMRGQCTAVRLRNYSIHKPNGRLKALSLVHTLYVQCKDCGGYWKATADYTVSAEDKASGVGDAFVSLFPY